jgi:hypothetical protein
MKKKEEKKMLDAVVEFVYALEYKIASIESRLDALEGEEEKDLPPSQAMAGMVRDHNGKWVEREDLR